MPPRVERNLRSAPLHFDPSTRPVNMSTACTNFIGAVEDEWEMYSDNPADYNIGDPIGFGASSIVYSATYTPRPSTKGVPCALKVLDLDSLPPRSLQLLQRETRLMSLSKHPNVLRVRGSWIVGHKLYIALRLMNRGSAADVMRYGWPGGMEEEVCRCILRQALQGLNYLHINGFIHRDIKAANLLIDDDGTVLLGDLGVAADLSEDSSHHTSSHSYKSYTVTAKAALSQAPPQPSPNKRSPYVPHTIPKPRIGKRKSFVGTPCWMAPELIQGKQYDASADIWSFGITAIELTKGRPPRSRDPAKTVLLRTVQEDAPTIDRENGTFKYSRAFKEIVDRCLAKDPSKRPTAEELLQMPFFKGAKKKSYIVGAILKDLPPLNQRLERCLVNHNTVIHRTVDSWDFATTIHSPASSLRRHMIFPFEPEEEDTNSVFSPYDSDDDFGEELDADVLDDNVYTPAMVTGKRTGAIPIPTSHLGSGNVIGTPASSPTDDSTPSSASDSPITTPKSQGSSEVLHLGDSAVLPPSMCGSPPSENLPESLSSLYPRALETNSKPNTPLSDKPRKAPASPPLPRSSHRYSAAPDAMGFSNRQQSPISTSPSNQGIWQKIRTNVRRPSFRASNPDPLPSKTPNKFGNNTDVIHDTTSLEHDSIVRGMTDKKDQSGVGRIASKGKQLYRTSSRTFQAVAFKQSNRS